MFILDRQIKYMLAPDGNEGGGSDHFAEQPHESGSDTATAEAPKNLADFASRFSASKKAPPEMGGRKDNPPNKEAVEQHKRDQARIDNDATARKEESQKVGDKARQEKPQPFIKQQIDRARTAEQERDELRAKVAEYEGKLTTTESQIKELQSKIDSGEYTAAQESKFQERIVQLEAKWQEDKASLVNENQNLKSRLSFYDLAEDETFQSEYVAPVVAAHKEAVSIIEGNERYMEALHQALVANGTALRAKNVEDRNRANKQRDGLLSTIVEGLGQFEGQRFTAAINDYIRNSHRHAEALEKHEVTANALREKVKQQRNEAYAQRLASWDRTFQTTANNFKDDATLSEDQIKTAKELGIDVEKDLKASEVLARKTITGETDMTEAINLVHRGRVYPALKAKVSVLEKENADMKALIAKMRGGGTGGGDSNGSTGNPPPARPSREEWQSKFSASRTSR